MRNIIYFYIVQNTSELCAPANVRHGLDLEFLVSNNGIFVGPNVRGCLPLGGKALE